MGLPEGVRDVVGRRLSLLSDDANEALRIAAVVGREFDVNVVATVAECSEDDMVDRLDEALARPSRRRGRRPGEPAHLLARARAFDADRRAQHEPPRPLAQAHRRSARRARRAGRRARAPLLRGRDRRWRRAGGALRVRGRAARRRASSRSTTRSRFIERALDALDALDDAGRATPTSCAPRCCRSSRWPSTTAATPSAARSLALEAATLARRHGGAVQLAEAGRAYQGNLGMWARPTTAIAIEIMQEALALLGDTEPEVRARAKAGIAYGSILAPGDAGLRAADEAIALAIATGDDEATTSRSSRRAWSVWGNRPGSRAARGRRRRSSPPPSGSVTGTGCNPASGTSGTRCSLRATSTPAVETHRAQHALRGRAHRVERR